LRLAKIYKSVNQQLDIPALEAAARIFIEDFPQAVFFSSLEGRFLYCNRKSEELSGYPRSDIIGKLYYQTGFASLSDLIKLASLYATRAFTHNLGPYRFTLLRHDGTGIPVEVETRLVPFGASRIIMSVARGVAEPRTETDDGNEEADLQRRLVEIHRGMSPVSICMDCKKIQAAEDEWIPIEYFLYKQIGLEFSHGYCPRCFEKRKTGEQ
ncbi:MAG TPA: PAS domain-containing protein, partial [Spirochaetia bacterium]|nr:PAS domain-containing protein [Spirochaetia bacterium]